MVMREQLKERCKLILEKSIEVLEALFAQKLNIIVNLLISIFLL